MARAGRLDRQANGPGEIELAPIRTPRLALNRRAHRLCHASPLLERVARHTGLVRPARSIHFGCTYALEAKLGAVLAVDRAINVVKRDCEADYHDGHARLPRRLVRRRACSEWETGENAK